MLKYTAQHELSNLGDHDQMIYHVELLCWDTWARISSNQNSERVLENHPCQKNELEFRWAQESTGEHHGDKGWLRNRRKEWNKTSPLFQCEDAEEAAWLAMGANLNKMTNCFHYWLLARVLRFRFDDTSTWSSILIVHTIVEKSRFLVTELSVRFQFSRHCCAADLNDTQPTGRYIMLGFAPPHKTTTWTFCGLGLPDHFVE